MNELIIKGGGRAINAFAKKVKTSDTALSLNALVPMDEKLLKSDAWYDWRLKHWGTKWDVEVIQVKQQKELMLVIFGNAWSPPIAWLEYAAKRCPMLQFSLTYDEPCIGFMGTATGVAGVVSVQEENYVEMEDENTQ